MEAINTDQVETTNRPTQARWPPSRPRCVAPVQMSRVGVALKEKTPDTGHHLNSPHKHVLQRKPSRDMLWCVQGAFDASAALNLALTL